MCAPHAEMLLPVQCLTGEKGSDDAVSSLFVSSVSTGVRWMLSAGPLNEELNTFSHGAPAQLLCYVSVPGKGTGSIPD